MEAGETLYEVAETSDTAAADVHPEDRGRTPNSLLTILGWLGTAYRLGRTRYRFGTARRGIGSQVGGEPQRSMCGVVTRNRDLGIAVS